MTPITRVASTVPAPPSAAAVTSTLPANAIRPPFRTRRDAASKPHAGASPVPNHFHMSRRCRYARWASESGVRKAISSPWRLPPARQPRSFAIVRTKTAFVGAAETRWNARSVIGHVHGTASPSTPT